MVVLYIGMQIPKLQQATSQQLACPCSRHIIDVHGDHVHTCKKHTGSRKDAHETILTALEQICNDSGSMLAVMREISSTLAVQNRSGAPLIDCWVHVGEAFTSHKRMRSFLGKQESKKSLIQVMQKRASKIVPPMQQDHPIETRRSQSLASSTHMRSSIIHVCTNWSGVLACSTAGASCCCCFSSSSSQMQSAAAPFLAPVKELARGPRARAVVARSPIPM